MGWRLSSKAKRMKSPPLYWRYKSGEEQRIAYAVLEGMRLQKNLDSQSRVRKPEDPHPSA